MPGRGVPNPIVVLLGFVLLGLTSAGLALLIAWPSLSGWYDIVRRPSGAMPFWMFPVCWGSTSLLSAIAAWRVWRAPRRPPRHRAMVLWAWQSTFGLFWCCWLFGLHRLPAATALVVFSLLLTGLLLRDFRQVDRPACVLMAPLLLWVCYATWLTAGIAWLNPT